MKKCRRCHEFKLESEFHKCVRIKDGLKPECIDCRKFMRELHKVWKISKTKNESTTEQMCNKCFRIKPISMFAKKHKDSRDIKTICKDCSNITIKEYRKKNPEMIKEINKKFRKNPKNKEKRNKIHKTKIKTDTCYAIRHNLRNNLRQAFRLYSKNVKTKSCKEYGIDFQAIFKKVGPRPGTGKEWHLDHIIPLDLFNFDISEHVRLAHVPSNLQWLPGPENIHKSDDILDYVYENSELVYILNIIFGFYD